MLHAPGCGRKQCENDGSQQSDGNLCNAGATAVTLSEQNVGCDNEPAANSKAAAEMLFMYPMEPSRKAIEMARITYFQRFSFGLSHERHSSFQA